ncbi:hypothetical protein MY4824_007114 [Beauveria thailandica]
MQIRDYNRAIYTIKAGQLRLRQAEGVLHQIFGEERVDEEKCTDCRKGKPPSIIIFTANVYGLEPLQQKALQSRGIDGGFSKEIADIPLEELAILPLPRLAPFLAGLATKFILTRDDKAMIAVEQLVDGMNLDESWVDSQLADCPQAVRDMIIGQINGKQSRIDYFSDNQVTCFIRDEAEAAHVSRRSMNGIIVLRDPDDEIVADYRETQQLPCMTCLDEA